MLPIKEFTDEKMVFFVSEKGIVKKTSLMNFSRPRSNGVLAVNTDEGDVVKTVALLSKEDYVLLSTRNGKSIFFRENNVTLMGRQARGVRGIRLKDDDFIVGVDIINSLEDNDYSIMTVFEKGYGKKTEISEFRIQGRSGSGVKSGKVGEKGGKIVKVLKVKKDDELMLVSNSGQTIRIQLDKIRIMGRTTQGVKLMNLQNNEKLVAVARILKEENIEEKAE